MSLGLLVGSFGDLVRMRNATASGTNEPAKGPDFPPQLAELREKFGHHIVLLSLLARSDGDFADSERIVIIEHCVALAGLDAKGRTALKDYLRTYQPALTQLDPALKRLEADEPNNIKMLVDSAERLIRADGRVDPAERGLLDRMRQELARAH